MTDEIESFDVYEYKCSKEQKALGELAVIIDGRTKINVEVVSG